MAVAELFCDYIMIMTFVDLSSRKGRFRLAAYKKALARKAPCPAPSRRSVSPGRM